IYGSGSPHTVFQQFRVIRPIAVDQTLAEVHGEARARRILGMNRHNTVIYGSGSPHTVFQQFRVIRPIAVDQTLAEVHGEARARRILGM
ncbi:hypothetical protein ACR42A_36230, partial [Burkholderia gladioli]